MADLLIRGGSVDVTIREGRIAEPGDGDAVPVLDASGLTVVPGFVELQCNGAGGIDLTAQPDRLWEVAALLPRWGVTAWLPTIVTSPAPIRWVAQEALRAAPGAGAGGGPVAAPLGLHFEGPFLSPDRPGAHATEHLRAPDLAQVTAEHWSRDRGVALVTLAPELPGALDLVRWLVDRGVVVSLGHSAATAEEAVAGIDAGARWATHLFNCMPPLHHRDPGLAAVALTDERLAVGVIADGLHVHPLMVRLAAAALGDRLTLVTDAVAALGMPPGPVWLGDVEARSDGVEVRLPDGTLAGSVLAMDAAVANLARFAGVSLDDAVGAATATPARVLGVEGERGTLAVGAVGDVVLLDDVGTVVMTVIGGEVAYDRRAEAA
jgi:N-acetylglucosamine-6-phosphate deacetylase